MRAEHHSPDFDTIVSKFLRSARQLWCAVPKQARLKRNVWEVICLRFPLSRSARTAASVAQSSVTVRRRWNYGCIEHHASAQDWRHATPIKMCFSETRADILDTFAYVCDRQADVDM